MFIFRNDQSPEAFGPPPVVPVTCNGWQRCEVVSWALYIKHAHHVTLKEAASVPFLTDEELSKTVNMYR